MSLGWHQFKSFKLGQYTRQRSLFHQLGGNDKELFENRVGCFIFPSPSERGVLFAVLALSV